MAHHTDQNGEPGHHGGPGGPLGGIFSQLTDAQKEQLHEIFQNNRNSTKAVTKAALDSFVSSLSSELQANVTAAKAAVEQKIAEQATKVSTLSQSAQTLYSELEAVLKDESLTIEEEHQKIETIIEGANQSAVEELKNAGIHVPLGHPKGFTGTPSQ
ncbi:unnamed protein product [Bursaphelenchus xylophilus]|uniref:(pine wood nematode) hypothetical protein n=1 Tax=Bursaphelenchus xylophilus TaxID=6326 RepID=A0A1I7RV74_BURXY|nr:unnamed protein product [Bursaphelenchus xylophilus]CAG9124676.1 unnamed protein product [Bursaphelenchus xylophilus]